MLCAREQLAASRCSAFPECFEVPIDQRISRGRELILLGRPLIVLAQRLQLDCSFVQKSRIRCDQSDVIKTVSLRIARTFSLEQINYALICSCAVVEIDQRSQMTVIGRPIA